MAINKVVYGNNTLIDLTEDTVVSESLKKGVTAHSASGEQITGTFESKLIIELYNASTETYPAGMVFYSRYFAENGLPFIEKAGHVTPSPYYILAEDCPGHSIAKCYYIPGTVCDILCNVNAVSKGDILGVSTSYGSCCSLTSITDSKGNPIGKATVAIALEDKESGNIGTVKAKLVSSSTMDGYNIAATNTTYGTCFMVSEYGGTGYNQKITVEPVKKGKIPFGVQANIESTSDPTGKYRVLLHTKQNDAVAVIADNTEIKIGDWLVPSATADGQVRNGSGYGIGEALTAKAAGASGLVKVHLNFKYGISPRAWWLVGSITEEQVVAAYQFVGMQSEVYALINVNNGIKYQLTKSGDNVTWSSERGFVIPGVYKAGLENLDLNNIMFGQVYSAAFGYYGCNTDTVASQALISGGLASNRFTSLQLKGVHGSGTAQRGSGYTTIYGPKTASQAYTNRASSVTAEGVIGGNWESSAATLWRDGQQLSTAYNDLGDGSYMKSGIEGKTFGQIGWANKNTYRSFGMTAVVLYTRPLEAYEHAELSDNIYALGGINV